MKKIYISAFIILCLIPLIGSFTDNHNTSKENNVPKPVFATAEGINLKFGLELNTWFERNFGFRNAMIEAENTLTEAIFGAVPDGDVIVGKDGWLFYKDTLDDYLGTNVLTDEQIGRIAAFLKDMQTWCEERNIKFAFTVAPNKNSLYPEYMPYYYIKNNNKGNLEHLSEALKENNVNYIDLYTPFSQSNDILYHKLDTHWNNKGAAFAHDIIMKYLKKDFKKYSNESYKTVNNFEGDIYSMLHPLGSEKDENIYYDRKLSFEYTSHVNEDNSNNNITTENTLASGGIIMYRDSFGNALLPFMAEDFGRGHFLKTQPYEMYFAEKENADFFIIEIAERNIPSLLKYQISKEENIK